MFLVLISEFKTRLMSKFQNTEEDEESDDEDDGWGA